MGSQISYSQIENYLKDRLKATNKLWNGRDTTDQQQENAIYFLYYFDFCTAIESCFRNIAFEFSKSSINGVSYLQFSKAKQDGKPYFLEFEELKALFNGTSLPSIANNIAFDLFCKNNVSSLASQYISYDFSSLNNLSLKYDGIKQQRNKIAHGLLAYQNGDFGPTTLLDFCYLYFILFSFYKNIYGTIH